MHVPNPSMPRSASSLASSDGPTVTITRNSRSVMVPAFSRPSSIAEEALLLLETNEDIDDFGPHQLSGRRLPPSQALANPAARDRHRVFAATVAGVLGDDAGAARAEERSAEGQHDDAEVGELPAERLRIVGAVEAAHAGVVAADNEVGAA